MLGWSGERRNGTFQIISNASNGNLPITGVYRPDQLAWANLQVTTFAPISVGVCTSLKHLYVNLYRNLFQTKNSSNNVIEFHVDGCTNPLKEPA